MWRRRRFRRQFRPHETPGIQKVARFSPKSVILIRRWQGAMSGLFRKLFG